jgi:Transposase, Mutator family
MSGVTGNRDQAGAGLSAAGEQVLRELTERARVGGLKLTGEGGLLGRLTKMVVEGALEGELDDHLGYSRHHPAGRNGGNSRNGYREKTVITEAGPVELSVPRDRDASSRACSPGRRGPGSPGGTGAARPGGRSPAASTCCPVPRPAAGTSARPRGPGPATRSSRTRLPWSRRCSAATPATARPSPACAGGSPRKACSPAPARSGGTGR